MHAAGGHMRGIDLVDGGDAGAHLPTGALHGGRPAGHAGASGGAGAACGERAAGGWGGGGGARLHGDGPRSGRD